MKYTDVKNPQWSDEARNRIDCLVKFDAFDEYLPFTATPDDSTEWGPQIFEGCRSGKWGEVAEYVAPEIDHETIFGTQKELLQMAAERVIGLLERANKHGIATEEEKRQLEAWEIYSVLVNRVEPGEEWPPKPE